jgi:guanylate kinase
MAQPVHLVHRKEFVEALKDYKPSAEALQLLSSVKYVPFAGLAGGGRNTVIQYLVNNYKYHFVVSDTTRPPKLRDGRMEVNGVQYFFRKEEEMLHEIQNGEFLEAELIHNQQVSGTSIRELLRARDEGRIPLNDVEFGGVEKVHQLLPDAIIIGLLPPGYDEWIRRFTEREEITDQELHNRLQTAKEVLTRMLEHPYFNLVINDKVEQCADDIREIVEQGSYAPEKSAECRATAEEILHRVNERLA